MRAESSSSAALTSASDPPHRRNAEALRRRGAQHAFVAFVALRPPARARAEETAFTDPRAPAAQRTRAVSDRRRVGADCPRGGVEFRGVQSRRRFGVSSAPARPRPGLRGRRGAPARAQAPPESRQGCRRRTNTERDVAGDGGDRADALVSSASKRTGDAWRRRAWKAIRPAAFPMGEMLRVQVVKSASARAGVLSAVFAFPAFASVLFRRPRTAHRPLFAPASSVALADARERAGPHASPGAAPRRREREPRLGGSPPAPWKTEGEWNRRRCRRGPDRVRGRPGGWRGR